MFVCDDGTETLGCPVCDGDPGAQATLWGVNGELFRLDPAEGVRVIRADGEPGETVEEDDPFIADEMALAALLLSLWASRLRIVEPVLEAAFREPFDASRIEEGLQEAARLFGGTMTEAGEQEVGEIVNRVIVNGALDATGASAGQAPHTPAAQHNSPPAPTLPEALPQADVVADPDSYTAGSGGNAGIGGGAGGGGGVVGGGASSAVVNAVGIAVGLSQGGAGGGGGIGGGTPIEGMPSVASVHAGIVRAARYSTNRYFNDIVLPTIIRRIDALLEGAAPTDVPDFADIREGLYQRLRSVPYWRVVASAAASRAYHYGYLRAAQARGRLAYRWKAVLDERTSAICRHMNGKEFSVAEAVSLLERAAAEEDIAGVKRVLPWLRMAEVNGMTKDQLRARGFMVPPAHGLCRSTIVWL